MRFRALLFLAALPAAFAQLATEFNPPKANCCLAGTAQSLADQLQDWNQLGRYYADNVRIKSMPAEPGRVVFFGDSITDGWKLPASFPGKSYVNRGIGGQTTAQMLVRMFPDVIALKPAAFILLAGTNDIARNNGQQTLEMITNNIEAMSELARAHNIKVILCTVLSISDYTARPQSQRRPPADILALNAWIKEYATRTGATVADYYTATVDEKGFLKDGFSGDGLHPNAKGYELMAPVAQAAIDKALR
ncbi:MAG TPA: SGNH/GDSL hydrolase family protein [Bryobacteraceae bacterium]|nr:SGNH/GDSL hydrolase family protein [Bryobacteraceae bacterium]